MQKGPVRHRRALLAALALLDVSEKNLITLRQFHQLLRVVRPSVTTNEIRTTFELLDKVRTQP